jgi:hypothetical protein
MAAALVTTRRFPLPWSVDEYNDACFIVRDHNGQALAYTTPLLAELGKKTDAINQLKKELAEKNVTDVALEARDRTLRDYRRRITDKIKRAPRNGASTRR